MSIIGIAFSSIIFFPTLLLGHSSYVEAVSSTGFRQGPIGGKSLESIQSIAFGEPTNLPTGQTDLSASKASSGLPVRLKISKINVDVPIAHAGITPNGAMEAPAGPQSVVWFRFGPRPGDSGSAVIAGHYGHWKTGEGSVFDDLSKLMNGDRLSIEDEKGATITFVVRELRTYGQNEDAAGVFFSDDGKAHLNLITCEGIWDNTQKTYSHRLIVFTDKEYE